MSIIFVYSSLYFSNVGGDDKLLKGLNADDVNWDIVAVQAVSVVYNNVFLAAYTYLVV